MSNPQGTFYIDVNTTKSCNLRCTYCFEAKNEMNKNFNFQQPEKLIKFINDWLEHDYFKANYTDICINFWGGEAILNRKLYDLLTQTYMENNKIRFFLFSNGYAINDYYINSFKVLQKIKIQNNPKMVVQVSYDGNPVHDKTRVLPGGGPTSEKIKATLQKLRDNNIFYVLKATIVPEDFKHMFEAYLDVTSQCLPQQGYFPTIDLHRDYDDPSEYTMYAKDLYDQLVKIAAYEAPKKIDNFKWFQARGKAMCSAGTNMVAIDLNGDIVPCHGALYTDQKEHFITNIADEDALEKVINNINWFKNFWNIEPAKCKKCENHFCLRCNIAKFQFSDKGTYEEKWSDHDNQAYMCYFFDIANIVTQSKRRL